MDWKQLIKNKLGSKLIKPITVHKQIGIVRTIDKNKLVNQLNSSNSSLPTNQS